MSQNKFHDHLDECEQCRNHPFDLCEKGYQIMQIEIIDSQIEVMEGIENENKNRIRK